MEKDDWLVDSLVTLWVCVTIISLGTAGILATAYLCREVLPHFIGV